MTSRRLSGRLGMDETIACHSDRAPRVVVCAPGAHPVILAACALCGVREVHRMGGAQAIAALAHGTETIERVDVIAGPGNLWVQEAKRLTLPGDMGERFKAIGFSRQLDRPLTGFGSQDLRSRL